jgi:hypothetical protein
VALDHRLLPAGLAVSVLLAGAGVAWAAPATPIPRILYWDQLAVDARLDEDGRLHITERQGIVFSGDWNGAERAFRLDPGQTLTLHRLQRLGPLPGDVAMLSQGSLNEVDRFAWVEPGRLRWRSRRPSDPPFKAPASNTSSATRWPASSSVRSRVTGWTTTSPSLTARA